MALIADEGLALFAGLNAFPRKAIFRNTLAESITAKRLGSWLLGTTASREANSCPENHSIWIFIPYPSTGKTL